MKVLALDAALDACQAAVLDGERLLARSSAPMQRGHQEALGPMAQAAMADAGLAFAALERIGVTVGPGSFTGVRVGLAFAKGLALALGVPLVGIGTLQALAASAGADGTVTAAIDGRRGQIYLQSFQAGAPLGPPQSLAVEAALAQLSGTPRRVVGPGAELLRGLDGARFAGVETPDPVALARLVARAPLPGGPPRPIYLRAPDARPSA